MRDHREGMDPTPRDITSHLKELMQARHEQTSKGTIRPKRKRDPEAERKARKMQKLARRKNR